jgi:hypothetical protein
MEKLEYFAVYREGVEQPVAMFASLEDAYVWATERFPEETFRLKCWPVREAGQSPPNSTLWS